MQRLPNETLGVGAVYDVQLHAMLESEPGLIDVVEVEPQTMWVRRDAGEPAYGYDPAMLARLAALPQRKLVHGVGFPVGASRPPDPRHIAPFVDFITGLGVSWASEHLAFNRAVGPEGPYDTGFLLPPLQTHEGVEAAVHSIRAVQEHLPVPFAIETGVNYLRRQPWEMEDAGFVAAVAEQADCGLLLDLHNVWTNALNSRQPVGDFMAGLPLDRVWEIHVAGGMMLDGYWLDAHSGAVPADVHAILREFLPEMSELRAVVFEIGPAFLADFGAAGVAREVETLRRLWLDGPSAPVAAKARPRRPATPRARAPFLPESWENALGGLVTGGVGPHGVAPEIGNDPGIAIYRKLIGNFRAGVLSDAMARTIRLMIICRGKEWVREVLDSYFTRVRPSLFYSDEARNFVDFLRAHDIGLPLATEVAEYELATIDTLVNGGSNLVHLSFRPEPVFAAIAQGKEPDPGERCAIEIEITPDSGDARFAGVRDALH